MKLKPKKVSYKTTPIENCPHKDRKHYAKKMCYICYIKHGRTKKAWKCKHPERVLYAKGMCKSCYLKFNIEVNFYNGSRARRPNKNTRSSPPWLSNNQSIKSEELTSCSIKVSSDLVIKLNIYNNKKAMSLSMLPSDKKTVDRFFVLLQVVQFTTHVIFQILHNPLSFTLQIPS